MLMKYLHYPYTCYFQCQKCTHVIRLRTVLTFEFRLLSCWETNLIVSKLVFSDSCTLTRREKFMQYGFYTGIYWELKITM